MEKSKKEGILTEGLQNMTEYLNQFILSEFQIQHVPFDMARIKSRFNKLFIIIC